MMGKDIYNVLKTCPHLHITTRVYSNWIRCEENLVGLVAHTNSNLAKKEKIEKIRAFVKYHELPVEVWDCEDHLTRIKVKFIK